MSIGIGSDHRGFALKERLHAFLRERGEVVIDFGCFSAEPIDYPDVAVEVAEAVRTEVVERGVLVCGTGFGMAIAANKVTGIFAAPVMDLATARSVRERNNVQILTLGAQMVDVDTACLLVAAWLQAEFRGGDSARKIAKIRALEERYRREAALPRAVGGRR